MKSLSNLIYIRLILPFQQSNAPIAEVSRGAFVGTFVGLTPTMGVQMYIAAALWVISRYLLRIRFNLPIAVALVWISNPITVVPIYYAYLLTGNGMLGIFDLPHTPISYAEFEAALIALQQNTAIPWEERIVQGLVLVFWEFGWPIFAGSVFWTVPLSVLSFPVTGLLLRRYRMLQARLEGLSYGEWKRKHIHPSANPASLGELKPARQTET